MELASLTIKKVNQGLAKKEFSCQELVKEYLKNIKKKDKTLNAFITLTDKQALSDAKEIDKLISQGKKLPSLAGVPMAVKDNILVEGIRCTAGSRILDNYIAPYDATVIKKIKEKGAVILGKTNLDEFAMGASGEHSAYGPTKNPNDLSYVPGGSSSGSAVAVAGDMSLAALGSDTAGSVRQPASFCGIVGIKPTYGAVSRYGLIAMASSLDQIGSLAKSVEDAEIIFDVIKGKDPMDSTSYEPAKAISQKSVKELVIGIPKECLGKGIQKDVLEITNKAVDLLAREGIKIKEVGLAHLEYGVPCYYIITPAESSSNLARYDGIKYGRAKKGADDLMDLYFQTRKEYFGREVKRRIMLGTYALSSGYYDAYYLRALKVRTKIVEDFKNVFNKVDLLLMPTSPFLPFKLGERLTDPLSMYMADLLTVPLNLAGLPGISVPACNAPWAGSDAGSPVCRTGRRVGRIGKLPVGIQFVAPAFEEKRIFKMAKFFESLC